jgi:hypothetical protein
MACLCMFSTTPSRFSCPQTNPVPRTRTDDFLELQIDATGTQYTANTPSQSDFEALIDGDQWMVYRNVKTKRLHWDFVSPPSLLTHSVT